MSEVNENKKEEKHTMKDLMTPDPSSIFQE